MTRKTKYLVFSLGVLTACVSSFMFSQPVGAADESLTLETYYPAPYGIYSELTTTNSTYLATEGGNVGIGTTDPQAKLEVAGGIKIGQDAATCDSANEGTMRYDTTANRMEYCNGTVWQELGASNGNISVVTGTNPTCPSGTTHMSYWLPKGLDHYWNASQPPCWQSCKTPEGWAGVPPTKTCVKYNNCPASGWFNPYNVAYTADTWSRRMCIED